MVKGTDALLRAHRKGFRSLASAPAAVCPATHGPGQRTEPPSSLTVLISSWKAYDHSSFLFSLFCYFPKFYKVFEKIRSYDVGFFSYAFTLPPSCPHPTKRDVRLP